MENALPVMVNYKEMIQHPEGDSGNREEIHGRDCLPVIALDSHRLAGCGFLGALRIQAFFRRAADRSQRTATLKDSAEYTQLTIQYYYRGVKLRGVQKSAEISNKRQFSVNTGQCWVGHHHNLISIK
jgi:hypothetical protein